MSDARILEKGLRRSRRARYSEGARSDHEDLGKGLDVTDTSTAFCEFLPFRKKLNDVFLITANTSSKHSLDDSFIKLESVRRD